MRIRRTVGTVQQQDQPRAAKQGSAFPPEKRLGNTRVFLMPTDDGGYILSSIRETKGIHAVAVIAGPSYFLTRLVRNHARRLSGLEAVRLLQRLTRCGMEVRWADRKADTATFRPVIPATATNPISRESRGNTP